MNIDRDLKGRLQRPSITSDLPAHLLRDARPAERWLMNEASLSRQQNEWLINVALSQDERQHKAERDLGELKTLRLILASKWSVIYWLLAATAVVLCADGMVRVWLEKYFNTR